MSNDKLIKRFALLAEHASIMQKECFNAIRELERINAPAPKGGKKKSESSPTQLAAFNLRLEKAFKRRAMNKAG